MQIEVYKMAADTNSVSIILEAVCDSFSSLLWDIECGARNIRSLTGLESDAD